MWNNFEIKAFEKYFNIPKSMTESIIVLYNYYFTLTYDQAFQSSPLVIKFLSTITTKQLFVITYYIFQFISQDSTKYFLDKAQRKDALLSRKLACETLARLSGSPSTSFLPVLDWAWNSSQLKRKVNYPRRPKIPTFVAIRPAKSSSNRRYWSENFHVDLNS